MYEKKLKLYEINHLKPSGNYMYHFYQSVTVHMCHVILRISVNGINQLNFVMAKCSVLF
jgi:hypothetical protein